MKKLFSFNIIFLLLITSTFLYSQNSGTITQVEKLQTFAKQKAIQYEKQKAEAIEWAKLNGYPIRLDTDGQVMEIQFIDEFGKPQYYITDNATAAATISTDQVYSGGSAGLSLDGSGITVREWDAGAVRLTHQEYGGRVVMGDGVSTTHYHSTHVAGTIMASGVQSNAKGMAYNANLRAFDWNSDESEMAIEAAAGALMSNHSYGFGRGWVWNGSSWVWYGNTSISNVEDYLFGFYDAGAQYWDQIAHDAPYYLILKSAGNDRGDGPGTSPPNDGPYDCIGTRGISKNLLTVGAVEDIPGGYSGPSSVVMSSFSSWGPADDGRIKPDIVTNGVGLYSTYDGSDTDYNSISGTSMATPSATGSLALLQQHWENLNGSGNYMLASTLKALAIHTADEAGLNDGPDYEYGWGLMNTETAALKISEDQVINVIDEISLSQGNSYTRSVYSNGTEPIKATICWTDVPGTPVAPALDPTDPMLVNDLDLRITIGASTYYSWKLDRDNPSNAATNINENDVDNVEVVYIASPVAGDYTVTVDHDGTLSGGPQTFSIIFSGISINNVPPIANFIADNTTPDIDQTVNFTDLSSNNPTSWSWSFSPSTVTYVGSTDATSQNPQVQFNALGLYTVTLIATNAYGNDTEIKTDYINVMPCSYCTSDGSMAYQTGTTLVDFNTINNVTAKPAAYNDYTALSTDVILNNSYNLTVNVNTDGNYIVQTIAWIDWNQDCDFDDVGEEYDLGDATNVADGPTSGSPYSITVPADAVLGTTRMRVSTKFGTDPSSCETGFDGEVEDYSVNIVSDLAPPVADFSADDVTPYVSQTVNFTDLSVNMPTSWAWTFTPSTITYVGSTDASSQNPQVQFDAVGLYTVSLIATNGNGSDTETKTDYIDVADCTISSFPYLQTFDSWTTSTPGFSCTADGSVLLEECWTNLSGDDIDWDIFTDATASSSTGPSADHTGGGNYLYTEASGCYNRTGFISTPIFDFSTLSNPELRFWYHMFGGGMGTLSVQVSDDGGSSWSTDIWSLSGDQGNLWQEATISLSAYALQSNIVIRYTGVTDSDFRSDMAIDDVRVAEETCYCTSIGNMSYETGTTLVDFNTINNATLIKTAGYNDYTAISTEITLSSSYNLTVSVNTDGNVTTHTFAWIDWNQDCDFNDVGEEYDLGDATNVADGLTSGSPYSITVPADAVLGTTRMRVSTKYDSDPTSCETSFDGEVEDYSIEVTPRVLTWTGNTSTDWNVSTNWDQNTVPSIYYDVLIPTTPLGGQFPEIASATMNAQCYDLDIESGAVLTIFGALTVHSVLTNNEGIDGIIIKSDVSQTGSLICNTDNVEATVERFLTDGVAHFIGAPVSGAVIGDLFFDHNPEVWIYQFHEDDESWEFLVPLDTPMPVGKGYYVWVDNAVSQDVTADFQGPLRSSDLTLNSSTTPLITFTDAAHGLNFVSNPFPSALDWDIGSWQLLNINASIWVWSSDAGNYLFRDGMELGSLTDGIVPVSQAFFIQSNAADPVLTIPADARVHSSQQFYMPGREIQNEIPFVVLEISNSAKKDEVWVTFCEECTEGYDNDWDVYKKYGDENAPQLYLQENVFELSIDALPNLTDAGKIIPLNFIAGENGQHVLMLKDLAGLEDIDIILEDLFTDHSQILSENPLYSFNASVSDSPDRFLLHIGVIVTGKDEIEDESQYSIYSLEKTIYIKRNGNAKDQDIVVQLFDIYGRLISEKSFSPSHLDRINTNIDYNIVIVRVIDEKGEMTSGKVLVK